MQVKKIHFHINRIRDSVASRTTYRKYSRKSFSLKENDNNVTEHTKNNIGKCKYVGKYNINIIYLLFN